MSFFIVPTIHTQRKPPHREGNPPCTLYLSLTSITPHTHYSQPLTLSLLGQFIGLWLFLTISNIVHVILNGAKRNEESPQPPPTPTSIGPDKPTSQQKSQGFFASLRMTWGRLKARPTRRSATGYSPLHSLNLNSLIVTALTYLLVSLFSFQLSRYGGQL
jgi:hypothetical protein